MREVLPSLNFTSSHRHPRPSMTIKIAVVAAVVTVVVTDDVYMHRTSLTSCREAHVGSCCDLHRFFTGIFSMGLLRRLWSWTCCWSIPYVCVVVATRYCMELSYSLLQRFYGYDVELLCEPLQEMSSWRCCTTCRWSYCHELVVGVLHTHA